MTARRSLAGSMSSTAGSGRLQAARVDGERVLVDCATVFDGTCSVRRRRLDLMQPVRELVQDMPGASVNPWIRLVEGTDLTIPIYRQRQHEDRSTPATEALMYADVRTLGSHLPGLEPAGETTIEWSELAPSWEAMTANVHDARDPVEGIPVTVLRQPTCGTDAAAPTSVQSSAFAA